MKKGRMIQSSLARGPWTLWVLGWGCRNDVRGAGVDGRIMTMTLIFGVSGLEPTRVRWKDEQVCATSLCQDGQDRKLMRTPDQGVC